MPFGDDWEDPYIKSGDKHGYYSYGRKWRDIYGNKWEEPFRTGFADYKEKNHAQGRFKNKNKSIIVFAAVVILIGSFLINHIAGNEESDKTNYSAETKPKIEVVDIENQNVDTEKYDEVIDADVDTEKYDDIIDSDISKDNDQTNYDILFDALTNYETTITLYGVTYPEAIEEYFLVLDQHPEIFWIQTSWRYSYDSSQVTLMFTNRDETSALKGYNEALWDIIDALVEEANTLPTDYEKALFFHDYLVSETEYDTYSFEHQNLMEVNYSTTAYGCLVEHSAVCSGYSAAYQLLLNQVGIECRRVSGFGDTSAHEWNYVVLGGDYYYVDVTWDDPISDGDEQPHSDSISHAYFCNTTDELLQDHTISTDNLFVPNCTETRYNYYRVNGLYLEYYSADAVEEIISTKMSDDNIQIQFGSAFECDYAVEMLLENGAIFDMPYVGNDCSTVWHSIDGSGTILTITLER